MQYSYLAGLYTVLLVYCALNMVGPEALKNGAGVSAY